MIAIGDMVVQEPILWFTLLSNFEQSETDVQMQRFNSDTYPI